MKKYLVILMFLAGCGFRMDRNAGIDVYKVGDKVTLVTSRPPCYVTILRELPDDKYLVKMVCFRYTEKGIPPFVINESDIAGRYTGS